MTHDSLDEQPEKMPAATAAPFETLEPATPVTAGAELPSWTAARVIDITLGLASVAAEAAGEAIQRIGVSAKTLQENAPEIREALEERGRPIREQIVSRIREQIPTKSATSDEPSDTSSTSPGVAVATEASPAAASGPAADKEIAALEQRVRELEQQVSIPVVEPTVVPVISPAISPVEFPTASFDPVVDENAVRLVLVESGETPAEEATIVPDEDAPVSSLANSEYAVSETEEEIALEGGEAIHTEPPVEEWPFKDEGDAA